MDKTSRRTSRSGRGQGSTSRTDDGAPPPSRPRDRGMSGTGHAIAPPRTDSTRKSAPGQVSVEVPMSRDPQPQIQRLPLDVLSAIFKAWQDQELCISDERPLRMPFYASSVCGTWREAAIATHELWTRPHFSGRKMLGRAAWLAYHACFADRAGVLGFDIWLTSDISSLPRWDAVWTQFSSRILVKARVVDLYIPVPTADAGILTGISFPFLETLRIHYTGAPWGSDFAEVVVPLAPAMKHLGLYNQPILTIEVDDGCDISPLEAITSLEVSRRSYQVEQLRDLAGMSTSVTEFTLTVDRLCDTVVDPFIWASLTLLRMTVVTLVDGEHIPFRMFFPNLATLQVLDIKANWPFWRHFIEISCPALIHLCVVGNGTKYSTEIIDTMGSLSRLRALTFRNGSLHPAFVGGLAMPRHWIEMPFSGLRSVHFENDSALSGPLLKLIDTVTLNRRAFLRKKGVSSPFGFSCHVKRTEERV